MNLTDLKNAIWEMSPDLFWRDSAFGKYPSKGSVSDPGDGGDDCLWLGLLTSVGFAPAAVALRQCQAGPKEPRAGMFYRNPQRRATDNAGYGAFFSKDMGMGVLCALGSKYWPSDVSYGVKDAWLKYIDGSRPCLQKKPKWLGGGCLVRSPIYYLAPDDRSAMTPAFWALMGRVWRHNGWNMSTKMKEYDKSDGDWSIVEAEAAEVGYQLHLHAVESWLKLMMGQSKEYQQKLADICYEKDPTNWFYKILAQGKATQEDVDILTDLIRSRPTQLADTWIWECDCFEERLSKGDYCGWDLVFLAYLIFKLEKA